MRWLFLSLLLAAGLARADVAVVESNVEHVKAGLLAEDSRLPVGGVSWIGLSLKPEAGWHTYWQNPGDAGLPTKIIWTLPADVTVDPIQWPYPERTELAGIVSYTYGDDTLLPMRLHLPPEWPAGKPLELHALAKWLICKDICIPGSADLALTLQTRPSAPATSALPAAFVAALAKLPVAPPADWKARFATGSGGFALAIAGPSLPVGARAEFFPVTRSVVDDSAQQVVALGRGACSGSGPGCDDILRVGQPLSGSFDKPPEAMDGVLVVHGGSTIAAYAIHAAPGVVAGIVPGAAGPTPAVTRLPAPTGSVGPPAGVVKASLPAASPGGLFGVLIAAMLGGLILNLMPCVFPVLSLKALSVANAGGHDASRRRREALAYTAGVVAAFALVAAILIALRAGGRELGWGFQLQSPPFVALLAELMFVLGLSMSGVVTFGTRFMGAGQKLTESSGLAGAFFTGVLAAVVASPCTAPFMGTALGFALGQPAAIALLVFVALALGMALPFLLIGFVPAVARLLPKPGMWMETFKQLLAFPLYVTAVWLVWVVARQSGADGAAVVLLAMVLLAFAVWMAGRATGGSGLALAWATAALALAMVALPVLRATPVVASAATTASGVEPYSEARLAELRGQGRVVFVNFTADWCLTCKVNERVALASGSVRNAFRERKVVWLEGDWTRYDPAITRVLAQYARSGVPLYLLFDGNKPAQVLPQILTPDLVMSALATTHR